MTAREAAEAIAEMVNTVVLYGSPRGLSVLRSHCADPQLIERLRAQVPRWREALTLVGTSPQKGTTDPLACLERFARCAARLSDPELQDAALDLLAALGIQESGEEIEAMIEAAARRQP
jgi:hypothetical protein